MNPINKALYEIKARIPREVLDLVFSKRRTLLNQDQVGWRRAPLSLDEQILSEVIRTRVIPDTDTRGGTEVFIPLDGIPQYRDTEFDYVVYFNIPKEKTQGRIISSVLNVTYSDATRLAAYGGSGTIQNSAMLYTAQAVMSPHTTIPMVSTAYVQLVGENVVMVRDATILPPNIALRCILASDPNMSHLMMRTIPKWCELCVRAVKAYIYNNYVVMLDVGQIYAGQNLGAIKNIIDGYADAENLYQEYLEDVWGGVMHMNDRESMNRTIKTLLGGMR